MLKILSCFQTISFSDTEPIIYYILSALKNGLKDKLTEIVIVGGYKVDVLKVEVKSLCQEIGFDVAKLTFVDNVDYEKMNMLKREIA